MQPDLFFGAQDTTASQRNIKHREKKRTKKRAWTDSVQLILFQTFKHVERQNDVSDIKTTTAVLSRVLDQSYHRSLSSVADYVGTHQRPKNSQIGHEVAGSAISSHSNNIQLQTCRGLRTGVRKISPARYIV